MEKEITKRRNSNYPPKHDTDVTPAKVRKKETSLEHLTKQKVIEKFKALEAEYNKLVEINEKHVQSIKSLKDKLDIKSNSESKKVENCETQTNQENSEIRFSCNYCIHNANCEKELRWHMFHTHNSGNPEINKNIICKVCFRSFESKKEMMCHMKVEHKELVPTCRFFKNGECNFSDSKCWFHHKEEGNQTIQRKRLKCNFCEKEFQAKDDLMNHRKYEHSYTVPECKYQKESSCKFENNCWYKHAIIKNDKQGNEKNIYPNKKKEI